MTDNPLDPTDVPPLDGLEDIPANTQIRMSESTMIATVALNMALKWHDTSVIKDGTMYQQLRMEGKEIRSLCLDHVFDTAKLFERHIMEASGRLTELTMETINGVLNDLRVEREETDEPLDEEDDANG